MSNPIATASNPRVGGDVEAAARACYDATIEAIRPTFKNWRGGWTPQTWDELQEHEQELHRGYARAVLASAPSPEAGAGGDLGAGSDLIDALQRVAKAAQAMPRETPAPGGAGTMHSFSIEAGVVWDLDRALDHLAVIQAGYSTGKYRSGKLVASTGSGEETKGADWLDQPIGGELVFEGMRFGKGVPLRTVIKAAQRWRRDAVAAFGKKVEARKSDGGARILAGLDDALAWAKGDKSRGTLLTLKYGELVEIDGDDTPKLSPPQTPVDPQELSFGPGCYDFASSVASKVAALPWAWAETGDAQDDRYSDVQMIVDAELRSLAPSDTPSTTEADR